MSLEKNRGNDNGISLTGVGSVIIPDNTDIASYVQRCYRNNTISISGGNGSTPFHNVRIADGILDKIVFPTKGQDGSSVVWIRDCFTNRAIVIGVLQEFGSSNMTLQGQQRIAQEVGTQVAEIFLDALNGKLNIISQGDTKIPAEVIIKASSRKVDGDVVRLISRDKIQMDARKLDVQLTGDFEISLNNGLEELVNISGSGGGFRIFDRVGNEFVQNEDHTQIVTHRFDVGQGTEPMVLGNTLVGLLNELIEAILNLTVLTPSGASGTPVNAATFTSIKNKLEEILSKVSNTD